MMNKVRISRLPLKSAIVSLVMLLIPLFINSREWPMYENIVLSIWLIYLINKGVLRGRIIRVLLLICILIASVSFAQAILSQIGYVISNVFWNKVVIYLSVLGTILPVVFLISLGLSSILYLSRNKEN